MVRPRAGGFRYTPAELRLMLRDAELLLAAGADGIVSGAIRADGTLDDGLWLPLRQLCKDRQLVFHRALDVVPDQASLLQQLIDAGTTRVLTSGGCKTAWRGGTRSHDCEGLPVTESRSWPDRASRRTTRCRWFIPQVATNCMVRSVKFVTIQAVA